MDKLNVAVIGVGRLGSAHARIYSQLENVNLVGVSDQNAPLAKKIARQCRTKDYTDYRDLIGKADAISVVVPTKLHYKIAKDLLNNKIHILVEKPITSTLEEAEDLLTAARRGNLTLQVGHVERFNSAVRAIDPLYNKPKFIECHRLSHYDKRVEDVGVVLDLMIHDIDIVLGLAKSEVENIEAIGIAVLSQHEDIANARITFRNKTICNLTASRLAGEVKVMRKIRIFQEDAYISLDYMNQSALIYRKEGEKITKNAVNIKKEEPLKEELKSFVHCVLTKEKPLVSGEEARDALKIALEIVKKINE